MGNTQDIPKNSENSTKQFTTQLKQWLPFLLTGAGMVLIISAIGINYVMEQQKVSINKTSVVQGVFTQPKTVKVDIEGAVERPGIYEVPNDYRIQDVLITAGGMTAKANRTKISETLNLSQKVHDGQKILIPKIK